MSNPRPVVDCRQAEELAMRHFGLDRSHVSAASPDDVRELDSFEDRNFFMRGRLPREGLSKFVFKILNHEKSAESGVLSRMEVIVHLKKCGFLCPLPVRTLEGKLADFVCLPDANSAIGEEARKQRSTLEESDGQSDGNTTGTRRHAICLLRYVPGVIAREGIKAGSPELLFDIGRYTGRLDKCLQDMQGSHAEVVLSQCDVHDWDVRSVVKMKKDIDSLQLSEARRRVANDIISLFCRFVKPHFGSFRTSVIHNDINDCNVLLLTEAADTVSGIIDFSECIHSYVVCELATCMAFFASNLSKPVQELTPLVRGFESEMEILQIERDTLFFWVVARLLMVTVLCHLQCKKDPTNALYISRHAELSFVVLEKFWSIGKAVADDIWWGESRST